MYSYKPEVQGSSPKRFSAWLPLLLSLMIVIGIFIGLRLKPERALRVIDKNNIASNEIGGQSNIDEILRYIDAKYVAKNDKEQLAESAINHLLEELDPHSVYIPAKELEAVNNDLEGSFDGIGIEFMISEDTIVVVTPLSGGPAAEVGLQAGDKIVTINDSLVVGKALRSSDVTTRLKGKRGTKVKVGIRRNQDKKLLSYTITRAEIPINCVDAAYMLNRNTGYIKINRFSATTFEEFMKALETMVQKDAMKNLVLDLRQNPGGYLQEATRLLSQIFKDKGKLLVYTEGRTHQRTEYETSGNAIFNIDKVAVLIDEGSASASEIVAGAIQDWDRGIVIGRRSFGKGLVQEQYDLHDGGALRLTIARYFTPSGRCIQRDYKGKDHQTYEKDIIDRYEHGELANADSISVKDTTKYYTKSGKIVYGGGGITPDVFIPYNKTLNNEYYAALREFLPDFVNRYFINNKKELSSYAINDFVNKYQISDAMINDFINYSAQKGLKKNPSALSEVKSSLKTLLKARIAKQLYNDIGFYRIWNQDDAAIKKALEKM